MSDEAGVGVKPVMCEKPRVYIIDVTNRDGVQAHGVYLSSLQRTMINIYLDQMGVYQSEFGFPADPNSPSRRGYMQANLELRRDEVIKDMLLEGWTRAIAKDVEAAAELRQHGLEHLNVSISTSQIMINGKFRGRKDERDIINDMVAAVRRAKELGFRTVGVNAEDASRTRHYQDQSYLEDFALTAKDVGADRIRYCDTLGCDLSFTIRERVRRLAERVRLPIELHCHDDTGFAVANSVEGAMGALEAGVDAYINTTVNGCGERAGNADLVSVLLSLKHSGGLEDMDILDPNINLKVAWKICNYFANAKGEEIASNQPGVGSNAFSHESGIHADGMLKDRKNYELFGPEELGIPPAEERRVGRRIVAGDYSGRKGLVHVLEENRIDHKIIDIDRTLRLVQTATRGNKMSLTQDELRLVVEHPEQAELMLR